MATTEERRLAYEARQNLGTIRHPRAIGMGTEQMDSARVEVYDPERDRAGHYIVLVPSVDPEGLSEDEALANHPATLAAEAVEELDAGWEITDVTSA